MSADPMPLPPAVSGRSAPDVRAGPLPPVPPFVARIGSATAPQSEPALDARHENAGMPDLPDPSDLAPEHRHPEGADDEVPAAVEFAADAVAGVADVLEALAARLRTSGEAALEAAAGEEDHIQSAVAAALRGFLHPRK